MLQVAGVLAVLKTSYLFLFQTIHDQILQEYRKIKKVRKKYLPINKAFGWCPLRLKEMGACQGKTQPLAYEQTFVQLELVQRVVLSLLREGLGAAGAAPCLLGNASTLLVVC